jgi:hypothetical protein
MLIAADARSYDDQTQTLICTDTLEHAMRLKKFLPEYTLVYSIGRLTELRRARYVQMGCCSPDEPFMDRNRLRDLTEAFERGGLKKVIATSVWNVGVSFNQLQVLIRAAGGSSDVGSVQIPGRVCRLAEGKTRGEVRDYIDLFDVALNRQGKQRAKIYAWLKFTQEFPSAAHERMYLNEK